MDHPRAPAAYAILKEAYSRIGFSAEVRIFPPARALAYFGAGRADLAPALSAALEAMRRSGEFRSIEARVQAASGR